MTLLKKYSHLLFFPLFGLVACSNELEVNAPYKETTIVYGMLNLNDTIQYIKVNKAFLGERSALEIAQEFDSLYHPFNIDVILRSKEGAETVLDTVLIPNESGIFAGPNNLLYHTPPGFTIGSDSYELIVRKNSDSSLIVSSGTPIVQDFDASFGSDVISFRSSTGYANPKLEWTSAVNGDLYELKVEFKYKEVKKENGSDTTKTLLWTIFTNNKISPSKAVNSSINGRSFYEFLEIQLDPDPTVDRIPDSILNFQFSVAAKDLATYIEISKPSENLNEVRPEYTNINGGLGLFSSRFNKYFNVPLHTISMKELRTGAITGDLGFIPAK